ncbi:unnamed protein product [Effrenium voratum]|nr:unnamed protein product [Effrenium voratum]
MGGSADDIIKLLRNYWPVLMGNALEWYEFAVYGYMESYMETNFFRGSALATWLGFTATFAARPLGGLFLGMLGDVCGRKLAVVITGLGMLLATVGQGLLPTPRAYPEDKKWGHMGICLLFTLRLIQGLCTGGEISAVTTYIVEVGAKRSLGRCVAFISITANLGFMAARAVIWSFQSALGEQKMLDWGWRWPFILALFPGSIAVCGRICCLKESAAFQKEHGMLQDSDSDNTDSDRDSEPDPPVRKTSTRRAIKDFLCNHFVAILIGIGGVTSFAVFQYGGMIWTNSYLKKHGVPVPLRYNIGFGLCGGLSPLLAEETLSWCPWGPGVMLSVAGAITTFTVLASVACQRRGWVRLAHVRPDDSRGRYTLVCAGARERSCYNGHLPIVQYLCSQRSDLCRRTPTGATLLHAAAQEGQLEVVAFLCEMPEVDKDAQMHDGATPLLAAALQGRVRVVEHLTRVKADIHKTTKDGASALHACARSGHLEVARFLCEAGADKDRAMMEGATPLLAAALQGHAEVVQYLCEAGADKDRSICDGVTAFHAAAERGHADVIRCLCEVGANKDQAMRNGLTPLMAACLQGHEEVVKVLCQSGVNMETPMREDLILASVFLKGGVPNSQIFLCDPPQDARCKQGATSLHVAALHGHVGVVKELCEAKANLEARMRGILLLAAWGTRSPPRRQICFCEFYLQVTLSCRRRRRSSLWRMR